MPKLADRVKESSTTTGTGAFTLAGAVAGYRAFSTAFSDADVVYYFIVNGTEWEVGYGAFTLAGTTLARTTVLASSNANALVNFSAGTKEVFCTLPASLADVFSATGKTTPVDADLLGLLDSAASNVLKKLTWANLKATIIAALGTAATKNTGTSGDVVPLLNANALHTGHETFQGRLNVASSVGGTVDAITMTFDPAFTALVDEMEFGGRATGANTSTTPTVNPSGLGALTIVKENLAALAAGDIVGAGHPLWFRYNAAAGKAVLLNPKGGGVSANFSAHKNGTDQTVADATTTKVTFTTESWDTGGYYDAANSRWTPPAGKRVISCVCYMVGSAGTGPCRLLIYKNGVEYLRGPVMGLPTNDQGVWVVAEVDANGTDYFEIYEGHATGSSKVILGLAAYTYFQGF